MLAPSLFLAYSYYLLMTTHALPLSPTIINTAPNFSDGLILARMEAIKPLSTPVD